MTQMLLHFLERAEHHILNTKYAALFLVPNGSVI